MGGCNDGGRGRDRLRRCCSCARLARRGCFGARWSRGRRGFSSALFRIRDLALDIWVLPGSAKQMEKSNPSTEGRKEGRKEGLVVDVAGLVEVYN